MAFEYLLRRGGTLLGGGLVGKRKWHQDAVPTSNIVILGVTLVVPNVGKDALPEPYRRSGEPLVFRFLPKEVDEVFDLADSIVGKRPYLFQQDCFVWDGRWTPRRSGLDSSHGQRRIGTGVSAAPRF